MSTSFLALTGWHDVFHQILNHLDRPKDGYVDDDYNGNIYYTTLHTFQNTLLSLALSCHAFLDPSLDRLWHDLNNIHPLLKLLPNYQNHGSICHLTGQISPIAWLRLKTYASRVRSIQLYETLGSEVWPTVLEQCQGTLLFPNLRDLKMSFWPATHDSSLLLRCLVPSSLRKLRVLIELERGQDANTVTALSGATLQQLSRISPGLVELDVIPHITIPSEHLLCLLRFTKVQRLRLGDHAILNEDVLRRLANLENLTELTASILFRDSVALVSAQLNERVGFRNLTTLDLRGQPADVTRFILASPMARLNDVRIRLNDHSADEFLTYIPSICQHLGPHTLTTFQAELGDFVHPPRALMDLIEPLFHFVNLKRLELFFEEHLPLRDADLERIARAWPQLQALILMQSESAVSDPDRDPGSVERPTLHGLIELARGCPELAQICIPDLDATAACIPDADSVPLLAHGARNLCIQNLVDAEGKEEQLGVAVVLDRVFPRLKLEHCGIEWIPGYGESANPHLEDSENVSLLLRAMQIARGHYPGGV